jgi:hypothetical protein
MQRTASTLLPAVLALAGLALPACESLEYRPTAAGKEGEILVVMDSTTWNGPLREVLQEELAPWIATLPAPEPLFNLRRAGLGSQRAVDAVRIVKNVVFAEPLTSGTPEAEFLRSRLDSALVEAVLAGSTFAVSRPDLWREQQQVFYVLGATEDDVARALQANGEDLRYAFNRITRERMRREMFDRGRQADLERLLMDRHEFAVNAQHDYFVAMDTTNFVWLRRVISSETWRSLFVWYTDELSPAELTAEWVVDTRDRLTRAYVNGNLGDYVQVDRRRPLESENVNFLDRFGYEIRGLWHMVGDDEAGGTVEFGMGGPFLTYAFYDQPTGRTYLIDGMVFAPGFEKRDFLRQLEVIAHTFRTKQDAGTETAPGTAATASTE